MVRKLVVIPFDATKQHFLTLLHAFFSRQSYFYLKYYRKAIIKRIDQYLKEESYDLIWLESGYMSYYGKYIKEHYPNIKLVYRSHNVEYLVLKNTASETKNFFKKYLIEREQRFLEKQEIDMLSYADKIFTITPEDRDIFIAKKPDLKDKIFVLSPSIDFEKYERTPITQEKNLVFI